MLEQQALVTRIVDHRIYLKSLQSNACGHCLQRQSCATTHYAMLLPNREIALSSNLELQAGDKVIVGLDASHLVRASLLLYLLPLLVMLVTVGVLDSTLPYSPLFALIGLTAGLCLAHQLQAGFIHSIAAPQIIRKL